MGNLPISANYGGFVPATNSAPTTPSISNISSSSASGDAAAADGGFVLYPNMSNTK